MAHRLRAEAPHGELPRKPPARVRGAGQERQCAVPGEDQLRAGKQLGNSSGIE
jgi:hypothetical protein